MRSDFFSPNNFFKSFIYQYWIVDFNIVIQDVSVPQRIIPNGMFEIFFHFGESLITHKSKTEEEQPSAVIIGQSTEYYDIIQTGRTTFVSIMFKPHAIKLFFNIDASEITNKVIDLRLIAAGVDEIMGKNAFVNSNLLKVKVIEDLLIDRFNEKMLFNVSSM